MSIFVDQKKQPEAGAIKPNTFYTLPTFIRDEVAKKKGFTDEERVLGAFADTEYWRVLKVRIDRVIDELDQLNESVIASGASLEEVGKNTIVSNLAKGILKRIFHIIEDARDTVTENGK